MMRMIFRLFLLTFIIWPHAIWAVECGGYTTVDACKAQTGCYFAEAEFGAECSSCSDLSGGDKKWPLSDPNDGKSGPESCYREEDADLGEKRFYATVTMEDGTTTYKDSELNESSFICDEGAEIIKIPKDDDGDDDQVTNDATKWYCHCKDDFLFIKSDNKCVAKERKQITFNPNCNAAIFNDDTFGVTYFCAGDKPATFSLWLAPSSDSPWYNAENSGMAVNLADKKTELNVRPQFEFDGFIEPEDQTLVINKEFNFVNAKVNDFFPKGKKEIDEEADEKDEDGKYSKVHTLYAQWVPNITITYKNEQNSNQTETKSCTSDAPADCIGFINIPASWKQPNTQQFIGWSCVPDNNTKATAFEVMWVSGQNIRISGLLNMFPDANQFTCTTMYGLCPPDYYCTNGQQIKCPGGSKSAKGSGVISDCYIDNKVEFIDGYGKFTLPIPDNVEIHHVKQ